MTTENQSPISFFRMSPEQRRQVMKDNPPTCEHVHNSTVYFDWSWQGCGFGQLSFSFDSATGKWSCDTESMGPESTRQLLHAFADYVADNLKPILEQQK